MEGIECMQPCQNERQSSSLPGRHWNKEYLSWQKPTGATITTRQHVCEGVKDHVFHSCLVCQSPCVFIRPLFASTAWSSIGWKDHWSGPSVSTWLLIQRKGNNSLWYLPHVLYGPHFCLFVCLLAGCVAFLGTRLRKKTKIREQGWWHNPPAAT